MSTVLDQMSDPQKNLLAIIVACGYFDLRPTVKGIAEGLLAVNNGTEVFFGPLSKVDEQWVAKELSQIMAELQKMGLVAVRDDEAGYFTATEEAMNAMFGYKILLELVNVPAITMLRMRSARRSRAAAA